nr:hypothetical protein [Tanacetum cinerariifolium]
MVNSDDNPSLNNNFNQDSSSQNLMNDPLHLASSDHPGMMLTSTPFNGSNFLGWSRTIKMALGAKLKLGFIDGSSPKPAIIHNDYQRWVRCDYIVTCWILNSIVAELFESFLYAQSASDLWKELEERYGQSNGPLIYHVEREISKVTQGNFIVVAYFNKLKKFWDDLHSLNDVPVCNCGKIRECACGVTEKFLEIDSRSKLIQFLMRLNDDFEAVRNQVLSMDPLPNLNKAYYIVQQVEKQKQVTHQTTDPTVFFTKGNQNVKKDSMNDGKNQGGKKNKKGNRMASQVVSDFSSYMAKETPFDFEYENGVQNGKIDLDQRMVAAVCQEVMKMFKGKDSDQSNVASSSKPHAEDEDFVPCSVPDVSLENNEPNTPSVLDISSETVIPNTPSDGSNSSIPNEMPFTRRSTRTTTQPVWLKDFVTSKHRVSSVVSDEDKQPVYPLFQEADFHNYPNDYVASLDHVLATSEPNSYFQAASDPKWVEAMEKELKALEINDTWELTKGFDQKEGVDYKHTFSPVAKAVTIRVLIAIATAKGWPIHQLDINNAFLHGFVEEEIYMKPPEGYTKASQSQVCKLNKSLYGLKQASRQRNQELSKFLVSLGFIQSKHDYSLFVKAQGDLFTVALVYVDDILIIGSSNKDITEIKLALDNKFTIKDLGLARYFWDAGLTTAKPTPFPLPQNMKLSLDKGAPISDPESYRRLVGRLLYLSMTRPDISYVVQHLSQFVSSPKEPHLQAATHLLRYLKGSINKGLYYPVQSNLRVTGFLDADWASCLITKKSLTGYCIFLGHSLVS